VPDIVEADEHRSSTRPATLYSSMSSPSAIKVPRDPPLRSASMKMDDRNVPPMPIRRSETMPDISPKRAKDFKSSNLRDTDLSGGYPTPVPSPDYPSPTTSHKYHHYPRNDTSSPREDVDYRRTVDRDYERDRDRARRINHSPEPIREPIRSTKSSATSRFAAPQPPRITTNQSYSGVYTTESPTSYSSPRPSPVRRETQRSDYDSLPRTGVPKANSSAKYEHSFDNVRDHDKDRRKGSPIDEYGYSSYRAPSSATRPHLRRQNTSDYHSYPRGTTVA
jgi:hypothetical protein